MGKIKSCFAEPTETEIHSRGLGVVFNLCFLCSPPCVELQLYPLQAVKSLAFTGGSHVCSNYNPGLWT